MHTDSLAPIFLTSSVTGQGLDLIRLFYNLLPQRHNWWAGGAASGSASWVERVKARSGKALAKVPEDSFALHLCARCPPRYEKTEEAAEFIIDEVFGVPGEAAA